MCWIVKGNKSTYINPEDISSIFECDDYAEITMKTGKEFLVDLITDESRHCYELLQDEMECMASVKEQKYL
jgi:hypothetical protein